MCAGLLGWSAVRQKLVQSGVPEVTNRLSRAARNLPFFLAKFCPQNLLIPRTSRVSAIVGLKFF